MSADCKAKRNDNLIDKHVTLMTERIHKGGAILEQSVK